MRNRSIILLFIRAPVKGKIKSRLAEAIGEDAALELYKSFILDIIDTIEKSGYPFGIFCHPPDAGEALAGWLGRHHHYLPQYGDDLGENMERAFGQIFSEGFTSAVLIGSDIPDLTPAVFHEALESLKTNDVVMGPAADGGYYLIGFNKGSFLPRVFHGITWGTNTVFRETMSILHGASLRVHLMPERQDVDTLDDLKSFFERNRDTTFDKSRTMAYLINNKLLAEMVRKISKHYHE
jgi:rSAM/selenodomain-associated transferase 1